jgi:hypothetical protein
LDPGIYTDTAIVSLSVSNAGAQCTLTLGSASQTRVTALGSAGNVPLILTVSTQLATASAPALACTASGSFALAVNAAETIEAAGSLN